MFIAIVVMAWMLGNMQGQRRGWNDAIKIARLWEGISRDWRMAYDIEMADTEHEREAIREVRELKKMYEGV